MDVDAGSPPLSLPSSDQPAAQPAIQPWQRFWLWCAPGEWPTMLWIVGLHLIAVVGLVLLPLPSWPMLAIAFGLLFLGGLGTTVAYHRALAHTAARLSLPVEQFLIFCAMLNGSGRPRTWVANHRHHHRYSDKEGDISSPDQGFWWSHLRWLWQAQQPDPDKFTPDMNGLRYRVWDRMQVAVLAISVFGGFAWLAVGSWQEALVAAL